MLITGTSPPDVEVLLIGGRSGVGKSTVGWEASRQLQEVGLPHCFIEGDNLDQIHPAPADDPVRERISEANLRAMWDNYRAEGQRRLIYTNTAAVVSAPWMTRALAGSVAFFGVLLTSDDETAARRLSGREIGGGLDWHVKRSRLAARWLEAEAPPWVVRVPTEGRSVEDIAGQALKLAGWAAA